MRRPLIAYDDSLIDDLAAVLDVEAGLREAMIYARLEETVRSAAHVLDVDAGLAAILMPPALPTPGNTTHAAPQASGARTIENLDPALCLALRQHSAIISSIKSVAIAQAVDLAWVLSQNSDLADGLHYALERALHLDPSVDPERALDLERALGLALDRARDLAQSLDHATIRARDLSLGSRYQVRDLTREIADARADAVDLSLTHDLVRARELAARVNRCAFRAKERALRLARSLAERFGVDAAGGFDFVVDLTLHLDNARAQGRNYDRAFYRARIRAWSHVRARDRAAASVLGVRGIKNLGVALSHGLLDDFTKADLSGVLLTGIDLIGVRWSTRGTLWPPTMDLERLRAASQEIKRGSDIYVVRRRPGATAADHANA